MQTLLVLALLSAAGVSAAESEIDKERLLFHIKETFNIPSGVEAKLGTFEKSEIPGLYKVTMTLSRGGQSQERPVLVSEDGRRYIVSDVQDATTLPDAAILAKLKVDGAPAKGPQDAKVTVVEFTDFQCPYCKKAHQAIADNLFKTYGDKVRLVFKHFPLGMHNWAEPAAVAAACVQKLKPEAFWKVTDGIFAMQGDLKLENVKEKLANLAASAAVNRKKFEACYDKQETLETVKKDTAEGDDLGVNSTPTLIVNGHKMAGFGGFEQLKALIDEMLAGTHAPPTVKN